MPRRTILIAAALALPLGGCGKRQPGFDERYDAASATIGKTAEDIDARIAASGTPLQEPAPPGR